MEQWEEQCQVTTPTNMLCFVPCVVIVCVGGSESQCWNELLGLNTTTVSCSIVQTQPPQGNPPLRPLETAAA